MHDIIIAGAGPAGLALASELGKDFSVIVLEKGQAGTTTHSWYSFRDRIEADNLQEAIVATPSRVRFYMSEQSSVAYQDDNVVLDADKILKIFKDRVERLGCDVRSDVTVKDFSYIAQTDRNKGGVTVHTNNGDFSGCLLIDCTGATSPIVLKRGLQKDFRVWALYGVQADAPAPNPDSIDFVKMPERFQLKSDTGNYMFGIYPKGPNKSDLYLFGYYDTIVDPLILKDMFETSSAELYPNIIDNKKTELKGLIYGGELKKYALDRVFFYGEAGALTPPAIGMGFNEVLRTYKVVAAKIKEHVIKNDLGERALRTILLEHRTSPSFTFLEVCQSYFFYGNTAKEYENGILILKKAGDEFMRKWMRNELDGAMVKRGLEALFEVVSPHKFLNMMPFREWLPFLRKTSQIVEGSIVAKVAWYFHRMAKRRKKH